VLVAGEPGVEVLVEGRRVGVTPRVVVPDLLPGRAYPVQARKAGFEVLTLTLENPDRLATLEVPLTLVRRRAPPPRAPAGHALGKLVCTTTPPGAEVLVDGRSTGKTTPISRAHAIELPLGMHTVVFRLGGQLSPLRSFTLGEQHRGAPLLIDATLR
jgi:hypothetical protein